MVAAVVGGFLPHAAAVICYPGSDGSVSTPTVSVLVNPMLDFLGTNKWQLSSCTLDLHANNAPPTHTHTHTHVITISVNVDPSILHSASTAIGIAVAAMHDRASPA
jgi:hypothetical protein